MGDSPVKDCGTAIALEILAEKFGANFFKNGALPLLIFTYLEGSAGFATKEQEDQFIKDIEAALGGDKMLSSMLMPKGISPPEAVALNMEEMQLVDARKHQRTVIAGAFGVPQHLTGALENGHYNNVEQQDKDFTMHAVRPVTRAFEAAIERDLLSPQARNEGIIVRFDLNRIRHADFKDRTVGLRTMREMGILTPNEAREIEGLNPRSDEYGDTFLTPSNMIRDGEEANAAQFNDPAGDQDTRES